jgi:hypothetical protein
VRGEDVQASNAVICKYTVALVGDTAYTRQLPCAGGAFLQGRSGFFLWVCTCVRIISVTNSVIYSGTSRDSRSISFFRRTMHVTRKLREPIKSTEEYLGKFGCFKLHHLRLLNLLVMIYQQRGMNHDQDHTITIDDHLLIRSSDHAPSCASPRSTSRRNTYINRQDRHEPSMVRSHITLHGSMDIL